MEQMEVVSWKTLDTIKHAARMVETIGDIESNRQTAVFCAIEEDFFELSYNELETSYLRRFEDEDEMYRHIDMRKREFSGEDYKPGVYNEVEPGYDDLVVGEYAEVITPYEDLEVSEEYLGYNVECEEDENDL
jgi:hypothetical protein